MILHELFSMLEKENSADYAFFPDTGKIIFMNRQAIEYTPSISEGDIIFRAMCGRPGYCSYCIQIKNRLSEKPVRISSEALCSYAHVTLALYETERGKVVVSRWDENAEDIDIYETADNACDADPTLNTAFDTDNTDVVAECDAIDLNAALESLGQDRMIYDSIARTYYDDGFMKLEKILEYFNSKDLPNLRIIVHGLKSASYIIGANQIAELAKKLEYACRDIVDADKDLGDIPRTAPEEAEDILRNNIMKLVDDLKSLLKVFARYYNDTAGLKHLEKE